MNVYVRKVRIGTRASPLARRQAQIIAELLETSRPGIEVKLVPVITRGDRELAKPLPEIGDKGLFTKELETALREDRTDLAVHSLKDLPVEEPTGLTIGAIPKRLDARDVLISNNNLAMDDLPANARIGTSSPRRQAQILLARPDSWVVQLRGNVETRLAKLRAGGYDAIVLALAGIQRLGLSDQAVQLLDYDTMLPAPGQGALAVQCRADDRATLDLISEIHHLESWATVTAERAFLIGLGGGCVVPVAAYAEVSGVNLRLSGLVAPADGSRVIRVSMKGLFYDPAAIGEMLAEKALALGAGKLLKG